MTEDSPTSNSLLGIIAPVATGLLFAVVAVVIALIRFRVSPLYPTNNDINSDIYVYQEFGNSWVHGYFPYRDNFDVKGPFLFLLFRLFAMIRPWSMALPGIALAALAFSSLWLSYLIARIHVRGRVIPAVAAVVSCTLIYLSVSNVRTSFTCAELAVPGVLFLLWLASRWLYEGDRVPDLLWALDGVVLGLLFWTKYPVIAPWGGMLIAFIVLLLRGSIDPRYLWRMVVVHALGFALATVVVLAFYMPVLSELFRAYFVAKPSGVNLAQELPAEARFVVTTFSDNTVTGLVLLGVLTVLIVALARRIRPADLAFTIAFLLSAWAAIAFVRHPSNFFVPLSFSAVAVPKILATMEARGRVVVATATVGATVMAIAASVPSLVQSVNSYRLLADGSQRRCYDLVQEHKRTYDWNISTVFARTANLQPILSVGALFSVRTSYVSHLPLRHRYQFVDQSWARHVGADLVQAQYVRNRTFPYVWIHATRFRPKRNLDAQLVKASHSESPAQPAQAFWLVRNYAPILACGNQVLLRAR